ncbi:MAG: hypothetical protein ACK5LC_17800 [Coprobacillaceae bacterium]
MNLLKVFETNEDIIKLKDGNNKAMIAIAILAIVLLLGLVTSKFWLPDGRDNATFIREDCNFNNVTVGIIKDSYNISYADQIGEVSFIEMKFPEKEVEKVSYKVFDESGNELPVSIIKGNEISEGTIINTDILIQFGIPTDIHYTKIVVSQGNLNYEYVVDYRDYKETKMLERDKDYLKNLNEFESELKNLNDDLVEKKESIKNETNEDKKDTLKNDKIIIEHAIKTQEEIIKQFKNGTYVIKDKKDTKEDVKEIPTEEEAPTQEETPVQEETHVQEEIPQ